MTPKPTHTPVRTQPSTSPGVKHEEKETPTPRYTYVIPERTNLPTRYSKQDSSVASSSQTVQWKPEPTKAPRRAESRYDRTVRPQQAERTKSTEAKVKPDQNEKRDRPKVPGTSLPIEVKPDPTKTTKTTEPTSNPTVKPAKNMMPDNTNQAVKPNEKDYKLVTSASEPGVPGGYSVPRETISSSFCIKATVYLFITTALLVNA